MTVFYRKYRPQKLSEIFGQEHVVKVLLSQLETGKISHGYLFSGPRGTGKTSTARILAKAVNCQEDRRSEIVDRRKTKLESKINDLKSTISFGEPCNKCESCLAVANGSHLDLIEIDAASNRGIDEIRDLREKIKLSPVSGRFKVYIIDEAHMLTNEAFNALLKTLEEPPAHAIFILCTTEESKLPPTIISRLSRFSFKRAKEADLSGAIEKIAKSEGLKIDKGAIGAISAASDGSYRDAISLLDQLSTSVSEINQKDVFGLIKTGGFNRTYSFVENLARRDLKELIKITEDIVEAGDDVALFNREVVVFLKNLLFVKMGLRNEPNGNQDTEKIERLAPQMDSVEIQNLMKLLLVAEAEMKLYPLPQIPMILAVCKYCGEMATTDNTEGKAEDTEEKETATVEDTEAKTENTERKHTVGKPVTSVVPKSPKSLLEIQKHWGEFLGKVKPINSHVTALLRSSRPTEVLDDKLTIEVFYRFHKQKLEEPKIISMLEKTLSEIAGRKTSLKFVLAQKSAVPTREVAMSDVVEIDQEEISKLAAEIFSK